jgi:signal transduction histidine kinase
MAMMIDNLNRFFELNWLLVFFAYGLVFFVIGLAVALQSRRHSRLELARALGWLAAFGLAHGLHEWGAIFIPIQAQYVDPVIIKLLQMLQVVLLALSFTFLFQFGVELLRERWPRLILLPLLLVVGWALFFILPGIAVTADFELWHQQANTWARYLLGFTGSIAAAVGLYYQAQHYIKPLNLQSIYRTLRIAGVCLLIYAILGGLIVPGGHFFPANWLNETAVQNAIGIPVPVFRSLVGLVLAFAIIRALDVFDMEVDQMIEQMQIEQSLAVERDRIGRDLHDGAVQQLYSAGLIVSAAQRKLPQEPTVAAQRLDRAVQAIDEAIAGLRATMGELRERPTVHSLPDELRRQTADPRLMALMKVELTLDVPDTAVFSPIQIHHISAILNEALSNAARHAQTRHVQVTACQNAHQFQLTIHDDGRGFNPDGQAAGYGLRNMRDRARLLGGQLDIQSQPNEGTTITLTLLTEDSL